MTGPPPAAAAGVAGAAAPSAAALAAAMASLVDPLGRPESGLLHLLGAVVDHADPLAGARCRRITRQHGLGVECLDGAVAHEILTDAWANLLNIQILQLLNIINVQP